MTHHAMSLLVGLVLPVPFVAQERPNIIYIMTDQQSAMAMSCAGNADLRTPNMDRLAKKECVLKMLIVPFH